MSVLTIVLVAFVAFQHLGFMILEMFYWAKPIGLKVFHQSLEKAESSKVLAANQGFYNGILAAGLIFGLFYPHSPAQTHILTFFLYAVAAAGAYGAWTVSSRILWIQALPAALALASLWIMQA